MLDTSTLRSELFSRSQIPRTALHDKTERMFISEPTCRKW